MKLETILKKKAELEKKPIQDYTKNDWLNYYRYGDYELIKELAQLPEGTKIFTICHYVSSSGMMRHIEMFRLENNSKIPIRFLTEEFFNYKIGKSDYYHVGGCGMDMGFALVNSLSYAVSRFREQNQMMKKGEEPNNGYYFKQEWF